MCRYPQRDIADANRMSLKQPKQKSDGATVAWSHSFLGNTADGRLALRYMQTPAEYGYAGPIMMGVPVPLATGNAPCAVARRFGSGSRSLIDAEETT